MNQNDRKSAALDEAPRPEDASEEPSDTETLPDGNTTTTAENTESASDSGSDGAPSAAPAAEEDDGPEPPSGRLERIRGRVATTVTQNRSRVWAVGALLAVVVLGAVLVFRFVPFGLPEGAALRVGDTVVTEQQLRERVDVLRALYGVQPPPGGPEADRFWRDAAKAVAVTHVLEDSARERGVVVAERSVQDTLNRMVDQQMGPNGREQFVRLLTEVGTSETQVTDEIRLQQLTAQLRSDIAKPVPPVSDADVRARYDADPASFVTPEQRRLRNIVVADKGEADGLAGQARKGADLGVLASTASLDGSTRDRQGDLGFVKRSQLEAPYGDAAFTGPVGAVFGPVQNQYGWNVGQAVEVRPATPLKFEQISGELRDALNAERVNTAWRGFLADQIKNADVDYADRYLPADPDAPPAGP